MEDKKRFYKVDKKLLPVKLHYFFLFAGYGSVIPFLNLLGKGIGISATAVGLINTTLMGLTLFSKPFMGTLVDYFRNIRIVLICLILVNEFSSLSLLLLPPIEESMHEPISVRLQLSNSSEDVFNVSFPMRKDCVKELVSDSEIKCYVIQVQNASKTEGEKENVIEVPIDPTWKKEYQRLGLTIINNRNDVNATFVVYVHSKDPGTVNSSNLEQSRLLYLKCEPDVHFCSIQDNTSSVKEYETYQFWVFACLLILAGQASKNANSLSDVACYEILGEKRHLYGRQRLLGTFGWSLACLLSGYLSDLATGGNSEKDYSPGFYFMICLLLPHIFTLHKMELVKVRLSSNIWRDVKKVFYSSEIILFAIGAILSGSLSAIIAYYELWYLQDLGASQSLLGWVIIVQCLLAEAPFFFVSGWLVEKFGCFNCLVVSFSAYALRFGCYSAITNPWWALLIDVTHGFTFAMFHAAMTNFVSSKSPEGIEGTMFGIFGGLIDGIGHASGSLLCGAAFDKFGERMTFSIASICSGACAVAFLLFSSLLNRCQQN